jgi:deoxyribose-phosphate aldolase
VYPALVPEVVSSLKAEGVEIASVGAGFPSSQTYLDIKVSECTTAVNAGATEIDIVISLGKFLEGKYDEVSSEIHSIKEAIGKARLKVILETGLLPTPGDIFLASEMALRAGADFIKTSTGKVEPSASKEAVMIMCNAISNHYHATGKKAGIKPAGGISTTDQALDYMSIVRAILGEEWLVPGLFRIGASRLANRVLEDILASRTGKRQELQYF